MPKFKVISVADGSIPVCVLAVWNQRGRIDTLKVKSMVAENAKIFVGKDILVCTTNREIIPQDIVFEPHPNVVVELPEVTVEYRVLSVADGVIPVCVFTVHDEEGRMDHLYVHDMTASNAEPFVGEEIFVTVQNKEIRPRDIKMKKYEIFPTPPMDEYDDEAEDEEAEEAVVLELAVEPESEEVSEDGVVVSDDLPVTGRLVDTQGVEFPSGLSPSPATLELGVKGLYWCEKCGRNHKYTSKIGKAHRVETVTSVSWPETQVVLEEEWEEPKDKPPVEGEEA